MGKAKDKAARVQMLPVEQIEASPYQARTTFDDTEIAALAVSILQNGLLQPVSVRRTGVHKYQLIAGERRLRACRLARLERVPALVVDYTDSESAALGLLENLQRAQLDPFDTARGIREVIRLWGCTQAEAARRLGLSQSALANKLRLLSLTPAQQQLCLANRLTERHARAALRLPENRRTAALEKMARDGLSVREADKLVDAMLAAPKNAPSPARRSVPMVRDVRFFVNTLQHAVDMMTQKGNRRHRHLRPPRRLPRVYGAHPGGGGRRARRVCRRARAAARRRAPRPAQPETARRGGGVADRARVAAAGYAKRPGFAGGGRFTGRGRVAGGGRFAGRGSPRSRRAQPAGGCRAGVADGAGVAAAGYAKRPGFAGGGRFTGRGGVADRGRFAGRGSPRSRGCHSRRYARHRGKCPAIGRCYAAGHPRPRHAVRFAVSRLAAAFAAGRRGGLHIRPRGVPAAAGFAGRCKHRPLQRFIITRRLRFSGWPWARYGL